MQNVKTIKLTKQVVHWKQVPSFLYSKLGPDAMYFEALVHNKSKEIFTNYGGGDWRFYQTSNGGLYMSLKDRKYINCHTFWQEYKVTADAAGIVASLFAWNDLCWKHVGNPDYYNQQYYALIDFAAEHSERDSIFKLID